MDEQCYVWGATEGLEQNHQKEEVNHIAVHQQCSKSATDQAL